MTIFKKMHVPLLVHHLYTSSENFSKIARNLHHKEHFEYYKMGENLNARKGIYI